LIIQKEEYIIVFFIYLLFMTNNINILLKQYRILSRHLIYLFLISKIVIHWSLHIVLVYEDNYVAVIFINLRWTRWDV